MSDILPDKIAETITNIIRKGNVFAKVKKIENLVYGCAMLVVVFGSSIIINDYLNTRLILKNVTEQEKHSHNIALLHSKVDKLQELNTKLIQLLFTPLNIYNGTPGGRLNRDLRATLPINELKGNPPMEGCPILNLHRCKKNESLVPFVNISELNNDETICIRSTVSRLTCDLDMNENKELEEEDVLINSFENNLII
jgi:hypothetical protein